MGYYRGRHFSSHGDSDHDDILFRLWLGSLLLVLSGFGYIVYEHQVWATWIVTIQTWPIYISTVAVSAFGLVWWYNHENFTRGELIFYHVVAVPVVYVSTCLGFLFLTDLGDLEISNGHAIRVEYRESYYVRTRANKTTTTTYHSSKYYCYTSNDGEYVEMTSSAWQSYLARWGGWSRVSSSRNWSATGESSSDSNGNLVPEVHTLEWGGTDDSRVTTSVERRYANFLKASDSVLKVQGALSGFDELLAEYPRTYDKGYGPTEFNRVVVRGMALPQGFAEKLDSCLDRRLDSLGRNVRCNVVVYFVGAENERFFTALQQKWFMGKETDIVAVISCPKGDNIKWCRVMSLTDHKEFIERLERSIRDLKTINGKEVVLCETICKQIEAPGDAGYLAKPMSDFAYLASEVKMPWWAELLVILGSCAVLFPTILLVLRD